MSAGARPVGDLWLEVVPGGGCLVHVPALPGLSYRAADDAAALAEASARVAELLGWLRERGAADLTPAVVAATTAAGATTAAAAAAPASAGWRFRVAERLAGAPVWASGNPAVLFAGDRAALDDAAVGAHLRVARLALEEARDLVAPLSAAQLAWQPGPARRSLAQTLEHLGNVAWWYASRLDDGWPEPVEPADEHPGERPLRLLEVAGAFLMGVPAVRRTEIHVPRRYPTRDPDEAWTHAKACRRLAEHALEHLPGVRRDAAAARAYGGAAAGDG